MDGGEESIYENVDYVPKNEPDDPASSTSYASVSKMDRKECFGTTPCRCCRCCRWRKRRKRRNVLRKRPPNYATLPVKCRWIRRRIISCYDEVSLTSMSSVKSSSYDPVSINFGKPVLNVIPKSHEDDIFNSISFESPIPRDLSVNEDAPVPPPSSLPIPAPRHSLKKNSNYENLELKTTTTSTSNSSMNSSPALSRSNSADDDVPPSVPPRNSILEPAKSSINQTTATTTTQENLYSEIEPVNNRSSSNRKNYENIMDSDILYNGGGARPKDKSMTMEIRHEISMLYDEAEKELERDLSMDLSVLEKPPPPNNSASKRAPTLLRTFDPIFDASDSSRSSSSNAETPRSSTPTTTSVEFTGAAASSAIPEASDEEEDQLKKDLKRDNDESTKKALDNIYVTYPYNDDDGESMPPPTSPPPPLPPSSPPPPLPSSSRPGRNYENIWLSTTGIPSLQPASLTSNLSETSNSSSAKDSDFAVSNRRMSENNYRTIDDTGDSSSVISSTGSAETTSESIGSLNKKLGENQRSFSSANLTKVATNLKRKMSEGVMKKLPAVGGGIESVNGTNNNNNKLAADRRHSLLDGLKPGTKNHSGVLFCWSRSKKIFQSKWCVLGNGNFRYFNEKDSLAIPKELILLTSLLSLTKRPLKDCDDFYCFDVAYTSNRTGKFEAKTFGARSTSERETWLEKLTQSLSYKLSNYSMCQSSRLGWAYLKRRIRRSLAPDLVILDESNAFVYDLERFVGSDGLKKDQRYHGKERYQKFGRS